MEIKTDSNVIDIKIWKRDDHYVLILRGEEIRLSQIELDGIAELCNAYKTKKI